MTRAHSRGVARVPWWAGLVACRRNCSLAGRGIVSSLPSNRLHTRSAPSIPFRAQDARATPPPPLRLPQAGLASEPEAPVGALAPPAAQPLGRAQVWVRSCPLWRAASMHISVHWTPFHAHTDKHPLLPCALHPAPCSACRLLRIRGRLQRCLALLCRPGGGALAFHIVAVWPDW